MRYARASQIRNNRFAIHASADPFELDRGRCGYCGGVFSQLKLYPAHQCLSSPFHLRVFFWIATTLGPLGIWRELRTFGCDSVLTH